MTKPKLEPDNAMSTTVMSETVARWIKHQESLPLPPRTGLRADKAFYDSLGEDEPGDGQFQLTDLA